MLQDEDCVKCRIDTMRDLGERMCVLQTLYFMEFSANFAALPLRRTICRVPAALCAAGRPAVRQRRLPVDSKQRVFGSNAPAVMGGHVIDD